MGPCARRAAHAVRYCCFDLVFDRSQVVLARCSVQASAELDRIEHHRPPPPQQIARPVQDQGALLASVITGTKRMFGLADRLGGVCRPARAHDGKFGSPDRAAGLRRVGPGRPRHGRIYLTSPFAQIRQKIQAPVFGDKAAGRVVKLADVTEKEVDKEALRKAEAAPGDA